jgi:hypothetical protein
VPQSPLQVFDVQDLLADETLQRGDPGLVGLNRIGGDSIVLERASVVLLDSDADQIAQDAMSLRQAMQRLAGKMLLHHKALELGAVGVVSGLGFHPSEKPVLWSIPSRRAVRSKRRTPLRRSLLRADSHRALAAETCAFAQVASFALADASADKSLLRGSISHERHVGEWLQRATQRLHSDRRKNYSQIHMVKYA